MKYNEMKEIDLLSISTKEDAKIKVLEVVNSELNDILSYINHLRYLQFNTSDFVLMERITKFLFIEEIASIERENEEMDFGENQELAFKTDVVITESNVFTVDNIQYSCKAQLSDNFESILIAKNLSTNQYIKFGTIDKDISKGKKFAYELVEEADEFYDRIVDAENGIKVNILSVISGTNNITKTYIKEDIDVGFEFTTSKKTDKGIISNVMSGSFVSLKNEELIIPAEIIEEEEVVEEETIHNHHDVNIEDMTDLINKMRGDLEDSDNENDSEKESPKPLDVGDANSKVLFESDEPTDIYLLGFGNDYDFMDDEFDINITKNDKLFSGMSMFGSMSIAVGLDGLKRVISESTGEEYGDEEYLDNVSTNFLIKDFVGKIEFKVSDSMQIRNYYDASNLIINGEFIYYDNSEIYKVGNQIILNLDTESEIEELSYIDLTKILGTNKLDDLSIDELQEKLKNAINNEDYEFAMKIKNQIQNLK